MKNIMVLAHDDAGQKARFQAALDVARAVGGHLTVIDVTLMPPAGDGYEIAAFGAEILADEMVREKTNKTRLQERLANDDVPWDWHDATGDFAGSIERAASLSDLIVVNRKLDDFLGADMRAVAGKLAVKSGRPVLAVPQDCTSIDLRGDVLVAWDGSPAADAALRAAVPLLQLARSVRLFEIDDGSLRAPASQAASYLSRHNIKAIVKRERAMMARASAVLSSELEFTRPAYVVIGGYGHGRLTEALLGGVTRRLLTDSPVPVFMAH